MSDTALLAGMIFAAALLYSSVGHAGASAYLAAMALVGVAAGVMKPTALTLNLFVATITTVQFARAGYFSWRLFWPLVVLSIPGAYLGGSVTLPDLYFKPLVGAVLLVAAARLMATRPKAESEPTRPMPVWLAVGVGGVIGLLSGLTGTGGGILLSPLLLFGRWATTKQASGVAAPFILVNSVSGLVGMLRTGQQLPDAIPWWVAAAVVGGLLGAHFGSRRLGLVAIRRLLGVVLVIAGLKMILAA